MSNYLQADPSQNPINIDGAGGFVNQDVSNRKGDALVLVITPILWEEAAKHSKGNANLSKQWTRTAPHVCTFLSAASSTHGTLNDVLDHRYFFLRCFRVS